MSANTAANARPITLAVALPGKSALMARYFFRTGYPGISVNDDGGEEFSTLQDAEAHAAIVANERLQRIAAHARACSLEVRRIGSLWSVPSAEFMINRTKGMSDHMIEHDFKSLLISMRRGNLENPRMNRRRLKRLCAALPLLLLAIPDGSRSQEISKEVPVNAQAKRYGTGWECKRGFRWDGAACIAIKLPENAYLSETPSGWECKRGYKSDGSSCVAVRVPQNAYLSGLYGDEWECERGYQKTRAGCFPVLVPKNGYLIDSFQGRGWDCDHGFRASGNECVAVKVPLNAYLSDSSLTTGWQCERGFQQSGDICLPIEVPRNGYLNGFGTGWKCERGFKKEGGDCVPVKLPTNAHLDYSGSDWSCDRPFRRQNDGCVLSQ